MIKMSHYLSLFVLKPKALPAQPELIVELWVKCSIALFRFLAVHFAKKRGNTRLHCFALESVLLAKQWS
jgi:hypothetical protein